MSDVQLAPMSDDRGETSEEVSSEAHEPSNDSKPPLTSPLSSDRPRPFLSSSFSSQLFSLYFHSLGYVIEMIFSMILYSTLLIFYRDIFTFSFVAGDFTPLSLLILLPCAIPPLVSIVAYLTFPVGLIYHYRGIVAFVLRIILVIGMVGPTALFLGGLPGLFGPEARGVLGAIVLVFSTIWFDLRLASFGESSSNVIRNRFIATQPLAILILSVVRFTGWSRFPSEVYFETEDLSSEWIGAAVGITVCLIIALILWVGEDVVLTFWTREGKESEAKRHDIELRHEEDYGSTEGGDVEDVRVDIVESGIVFDGLASIVDSNLDLKDSYCSFFKVCCCCCSDDDSDAETKSLQDQDQEGEEVSLPSSRTPDSDSYVLHNSTTHPSCFITVAILRLLLWSSLFTIVLYWLHAFVISPIVTLRWTSGGEFGGEGDERSLFSFFPYGLSAIVVLSVFVAILISMWEKLSWIVLGQIVACLTFVCGVTWTFVVSSYVLALAGIGFVFSVVLLFVSLWRVHIGEAAKRPLVGGVSFAVLLYAFVTFAGGGVTLGRNLPGFGDMFGQNEELFRMLCLGYVFIGSLILFGSMNWKEWRSFRGVVLSLLIPFHWESERKEKKPSLLSKTPIMRCVTIIFLYALCAVFIAIFFMATRFEVSFTSLKLMDIDPSTATLPNGSMPVFRFISYNVHLGVDQRGVSSFHRVSSFLRKSDFAFAGIQESNLGGPHSGFESLSDYLGHQTSAIASTKRDRDEMTMGCVSLIRTEVSRCQSYVFVAGADETDVAEYFQICTLMLPRWNNSLPPVAVDVFNLHLSHMPKANDPQLVSLLTNYVRESVPTILLGDFNVFSPNHDPPDATYYRLGNASFVDSVRELTGSYINTRADEENETIDYVMYRGYGLIEPIAAKVDQSQTGSDHYPLIVDFVVL